MVELKIKLAEGATMPSKANDSDTGYDITATGISYNEEYGFLEYSTGVFMEIPKGYEVKIYPRSSISKYDLFLCNSVGVIDETYRQEIKFRFKTTFDYDNAILDKDNDLKIMAQNGYPTPIYPKIYRIGDKIGQFEMKKKDLYVVKQVDIIEETSRGGFGSTTLLEKMLDKKNEITKTRAEEYANGTRKTIVEYLDSLPPLNNPSSFA